MQNRSQPLVLSLNAQQRGLSQAEAGAGRSRSSARRAGVQAPEPSRLPPGSALAGSWRQELELGSNPSSTRQHRCPNREAECPFPVDTVQLKVKKKAFQGHSERLRRHQKQAGGRSCAPPLTLHRLPTSTCWGSIDKMISF